MIRYATAMTSYSIIMFGVFSLLAGVESAHARNAHHAVAPWIGALFLWLCIGGGGALICNAHRYWVRHCCFCSSRNWLEVWTPWYALAMLLVLDLFIVFTIPVPSFQRGMMAISFLTFGLIIFFLGLDLPMSAVRYPRKLAFNARHRIWFWWKMSQLPGVVFLGSVVWFWVS